jgi:hypothetical protein
MGANEQQTFGSFTRMHDAGFGPMKDRAGVYAREDRGIIDTQHLDVT